MGDYGGNERGLIAPNVTWIGSALELVVASLDPESVELLTPPTTASGPMIVAATWHRPGTPTHLTTTPSLEEEADSAAPTDGHHTTVLTDGTVLAVRRTSWGEADEERLVSIGRVVDGMRQAHRRAEHLKTRLHAAATTLFTTDAELRITSIDQLAESDGIADIIDVGVELTGLFDVRDIAELERQVQREHTDDGSRGQAFTIGTLLRPAAKFANVTFVPSIGPDGDLEGFGVQIADRSREIELIRRSDRNRRLGGQLVEGAPLGVVILDADAHIEHINDIAKHFLGDVTGMDVDQLGLPPDIAEELQIAFEAGEPGAFEWRHPTIALNCTVAPIFDVAELSHVVWYIDPRNDARNADSLGNLDLELSIRGAIEDEAIGLRFQPEFDARTGELRAIEALALAYTHDRVMTGEQFIPAAEAAGIVASIDAAVLGRAIAQAAAWVQGGWTDAVVRINVSTATLRDPTFVERLTAQLTVNDLPGRHICLEITETGVITDPILAEEAMTAIRALDVTVALDDFGTGHSSLARLARFGTDVLKLDQAFAGQIAQSEQTRVVVEAVVHLAHRLDAIVVAEGVQNERQRALLTQLGCDRLQGHFLSRPLAAEHIDIARLIANPLPAIVGATTETIDLRD